MTNVLPPRSQKKVWALYRGRFIALGSFVLLGLALFAAAALVPSQLALTHATPPVSEDLGDTERDFEPTEIARAQRLMLEIEKMTMGTSSVQSVKAALGAKPTGVSIERITFDGANNSVSISGSAPRDSVNAYRTALQDLAQFTDVSVPVSALVGLESGHFSITIQTN